MHINKIIVNIITITVIASVLAFAGCVGKESTTPTATPSPTSTPKQVVSTPIITQTPTPTPTPTPTATPTPKEKVNVTLKAGYKWYQNNEFGYRIGYPKNWVTQDVSLSKGQESGLLLMPEKLDDGTPNMGAIVIMVIVYSDPKQAKIWEDPNFENYKQQGAVSKYGEITINGRKGYEVIMSPLPIAKNRIVVFTIGDLYYTVNAAAQKELFNKYESTFNDSINSFIIEK